MSGKVKVWNPDRIFSGPKAVYEGHRKRILYGGLGRDEMDREVLVTGAGDESLKFWNVGELGKKLHGLYKAENNSSPGSQLTTVGNLA